MWGVAGCSGFVGYWLGIPNHAARAWRGIGGGGGKGKAEMGGCVGGKPWKIKCSVDSRNWGQLCLQMAQKTWGEGGKISSFLCALNNPYT